MLINFSDIFLDKEEANILFETTAVKEPNFAREAKFEKTNLLSDKEDFLFLFFKNGENIVSTNPLSFLFRRSRMTSLSQGISILTGHCGNTT